MMKNKEERYGSVNFPRVDHEGQIIHFFNRYLLPTRLYQKLLPLPLCFLPFYEVLLLELAHERTRVYVRVCYLNHLRYFRVQKSLTFLFRTHFPLLRLTATFVPGFVIKYFSQTHQLLHLRI